MTLRAFNGRSDFLGGDQGVRIVSLFTYKSLEMTKRSEVRLSGIIPVKLLWLKSLFIWIKNQFQGKPVASERKENKGIENIVKKGTAWFMDLSQSYMVFQ